jgi:hypothetical protein
LLLISNGWGTLTFSGALYLATFLIAYKIEKRNRWIMKALIFFALASLLSFAYNEILGLFELDALFNQFLRTMNCVLLFIFVLVTMRICCICNLWEALFCCAAGYCMQHSSQRLSVLVSELFFHGGTPIINAVILIVITGALYFIVFYKLISHGNYSSIMADSKIQIIITIIVLFATVMMSAYAGLFATSYQAHELQLYIYGFSIITSTLALFVEFCLLFQKNTEIERDILKKLMHENQNQYMIEKSTIDAINIKYHDLKYQFRKLERKLDPEDCKEIKEAVYAYDFIFKTGNNALDTVLTMKGLLCENKNIVMTCIADGKSLEFMSEADIYSLFGNILDNAVEAVDKLNDLDKRIIGLTITRKNGFLFIHAENYHTEKLYFVDGLPQTTKKDKVYHGFGMHSIQLLTMKYKGICTVDALEETFALDIMLPLEEIR